MSEQKYQPKNDEKQYVHVLVSEKQGQPVSPAKVELYYPANLASVMGLKGFKGEIVYDPRTADQKEQAAPAADTVKADEPLDSPESYRARYRTLFKEDAPFNLTADEVQRIADRAEAKLADLAKGIEPADSEDADKTPFKAPTDKVGWLALYRAAHPEDTTEDKDLTVAAIREKLAK